MNNWIVEASPVSAQPSRVTTVVFVLLLLVPMAGTVLYGAVDAAVLGLASVLVGIVAVLWLVHAWSIGELRFSTSAIQLPIIAIIAIGLVQLLPFGGHGVSGGELTSVGVTRSLTLDPFATRLFIAQLTVFLVFLAAALVFFDSPSRVKRSAVAIVIFASVMAFFGILQKLSDPEAIYGLRPTPQAIPFGPLVNQHHFAAFMEMSSGLTLALIFGAGLKRDRKLLLWIAAVVMGIALVFTGSRGGVISYAGVVLFVISASYLFTSRTKEPADDHRANRLSLIAGATALALIIAGLAFYLAAHAVGVNLAVVAQDLPEVWWRYPVLVLAALKNALVEELVLLGFVLLRLRQLGLGARSAVVVAAVLRGTYHLYQGVGGFVGNLVMGLLFGWLYQRWGRVTPFVVAHTLLNVGAFVGYALLVDRVPWLPS